MDPNNQQIDAGHAVYSRRTLSLYDWLVLGISNRLIWKCPSQRILQLYNQHASNNHLDAGVGTGYFLDRCQFPSGNPRIALFDLNRNSLEYTANRISRFQPKSWCGNVLEPITLDGQKFDSIGISYLLHCLPGSLESKALALDHLKALMHPDARLFGATILHAGVPRTWMARRLMKTYNRRRIFCNLQDDLDSLERVLRNRFQDVQINVAGCVALFSGRNQETTNSHPD